ncbi:aminopeptidase [Chitinimonas sp. BJB300]|nr:aminopeptidase [Chitinimonas sp. BJB300]TSJ87434.1 M20/M25/M40 family metallo-hydrolase [Chitinimonas sp. BJB300]
MFMAGALMSNPVLAAPKKIWVTLDDATYAQLQELASEVAAYESRAVANRAENNLVTGVNPEGIRLKRSFEFVHAVEVEEALLPRLSKAIQQRSKRHGGYRVHNSQEEALAALQPLIPATQAIRPSYTIDNQAAVSPLLAQMQDSNIASTIADLSAHPNRYYTSIHGVRASNWLLRRWQWLAAGRSDVTVEQFTHRAFPQKSVILTIQGTDNANEVVVLGGHLDTVTDTSNIDEDARAPGADDNASGIASLTEVARVLLTTNYKPRRTIKFMAYAAEEAGLLGSKDIAQKFKADNINVVGVMQLDMVNRKGSEKDIYIYTDNTDRQQNTFIANLITTYLPTLTIGYDQCGNCSDHVSWHNEGYWASMPSEAAARDINPHIHSADDTYANTGNQALHALKFSRVGLAFAVELGSDGPTVDVRFTLPRKSGAMSPGASSEASNMRP